MAPLRRSRSARRANTRSNATSSMTDNSIDPLEAAQRDCEAAEQHVSDCRDALERAERAAAAAREKLKALSDGREAPKAPPPEVAEVPKAPPPTSGMKGIFTRAPLPETKAERREAQEIAELRSMEEPPCWSSETLLCELRACAASSGAPSCTLATAPLDWGGLARARQAGRLCVSNVGVDGAPMLADACPPVGDFWVVLLPPVAAAGGEGEEEAVVCLGQTAQGGLCGAIGWWPAGSLSKADGPRAAATAARCVAMDDAACAAEWMQHVTVIGLGEGGSAPTPASSNVHAPPPCQLAEAVRGGLLAKRQIRARLQRGGAAEAEKAHCKLLLEVAQRRLEACGRELARTGALEAELGKCGAALHGLRKTLLPRSWDPRCSVCGVRHKDIEIHTCKFWQEWASAALVTGE